MDAAASSDDAVSMWTIVLGVVTLGYYIFIWSLSLLGLRQARQLFGTKSYRKGPSTGFRDDLPLRHASTPVPDLGAHEQKRTGQAGVSILRPLAGLDHNLANNLASAFEQRYPRHLYEIILSVRDDKDQALPVARSICARYPDVHSQIIVGAEPNAGVNPKIANLVRPYASAAFDIVWVLDSQVLMSPYALARAVHAINDRPRTPSPHFLRRKPHGTRVGLAHHVPLGVTPHSTSFGSHIEATFLSTNHAKMYLAINALSIESCVMGKSNLYRKSDLDCVPDTFFNVASSGTRGETGAIGSVAFESAARDGESSVDSVSGGPSRALARFGIYLAEDNMLATSLWRPPLNLAHTLIAADIARTSVGDVKSLHAYWKRRVRWIRVRRHMVPAATYIEPFTESLMCGVIAANALLNCWLPMTGMHLSQTSTRWLVGLLFFAIHLLLWHLVDFAVLASLQSTGERSPQSLSDGHAASGATAASLAPLVDFGNAAQVRMFRLAWLGREVLALPIWVAALCDNKVYWRGRQYRILSDSRAAHVDSDAHDFVSVEGLLPRIATLLGWDGKRKRPSARYERVATDSGASP